MKPATPIINAVGQDRVCHIVQSLVKCRGQLDPEAQRTLDDAVLEFLGRNPLALATLMLDNRLPDSHPDVVEAILKRAFDRVSESGRERVEQHAMEAGYFDLFGQAKAKDETFLTRSQRAGLDRMLGLARLHYEGAVRHGVRLRTWPLLVGPSGVGKSNLAGRLADELGDLPLLKLSYGEWIVSGSRSDVSTLQRLRAAVEKHDRFVIFIDELDKIHAATPDPWSRALLTELFGVLDGRIGVGDGRGGWPATLVRGLAERAFLVGAGTWQDLWGDRGARGMGFGGVTRSPGVPERIRDNQTIPLELMNRFSPDWVVLDPYTATDFEEIAACLKLSAGVLDPVAAAASGLNFRAVEAAVTEHSLRQMLGGEF